MLPLLRSKISERQNGFKKSRNAEYHFIYIYFFVPLLRRRTRPKRKGCGSASVPVANRGPSGECPILACFRRDTASPDRDGSRSRIVGPRIHGRISKGQGTSPGNSTVEQGVGPSFQGHAGKSRLVNTCAWETDGKKGRSGGGSVAPAAKLCGWASRCETS